MLSINWLRHRESPKRENENRKLVSCIASHRESPKRENENRKLVSSAIYKSVVFLVTNRPSIPTSLSQSITSLFVHDLMEVWGEESTRSTVAAAIQQTEERGQRNLQV